ncbi:hypothetical protein Taro_027132 [Colocasia esculenta]|uniref:Uncharacterized protein n=1 Tax=Colocasia esculenta TaxID=4460 RepID=A0A843VH72_COLES|nr:hypothetical protein [Colocasia esculenta]
MRASRLLGLSCVTSQQFGVVPVVLALSFLPGAWHLRAYPVQRLSPLPGTPVLGSLLREYSGLRACSSWQPTRRTLELRGKRVFPFSEFLLLWAVRDC